MKRFLIMLFVLIPVVVLTKCRLIVHDPGLPNPTSITKFSQTEFVPTLENKLAENKNIIYSSSLLYAWQVVKQTFNPSLILNNPNASDFRLMNESTSFNNSLNKGEIRTEASFGERTIDIRAFFNKELLFPSKLQKIDEGILFDKRKVAAFGMKEVDEKITNFTQIAFYRDDDNFIIELTPKDTLNSIVIAKGLQNVKTLADAVKQTNVFIEKGNHEKLNPKMAWKYKFDADDEFSIPIVRFNIEANYKNIAGQTFLVAGKKYTIETAYQRTGLTLDENGGVVESEARVTSSTDSTGVTEKVHPKNMAFNRPFFIIIKRVGGTNPYFVMKVDNAELLKKI